MVRLSICIEANTKYTIYPDIKSWYIKSSASGWVAGLEELIASSRRSPAWPRIAQAGAWQIRRTAQSRSVDPNLFSELHASRRLRTEESPSDSTPRHIHHGVSRRS